MYVTEQADHAAFTAPHSPSMNATAWRRRPGDSIGATVRFQHDRIPVLSID
jgi:hypothetical protein